MATMAELLAKAQAQLSSFSSTPALDSEILLALVLKKDRLWLTAHHASTVNQRSAKAFQKLVLKRKKGIPIAYLTHHKEFFGRDFYVDRRALIPRPDSEPIVEAALKLLRGKKHPSILEIGTGSGCLAITLALEIPPAQVWATDKSKAALKVALQNVEQFKLSPRVKLVTANLLQFKTAVPNKFDLVLANLPYVPAHWVKNSDPDTKGLVFEPKISLVGGRQGLELITIFLKQFAANPLSDQLLLEHGDRQSQALILLAKKIIPFYKAQVIKDLHHQPRGLLLSLDN